MTVNFHNNAIKSIEKMTLKEKDKVRSKISDFTSIYHKTGLIPYNELQIKKLDGKWKGFYRMNVGKKRLIFSIDSSSWTMTVFEIDYRGDIYKKK